MIAFDTNLVIRLMVGDDASQASKAQRILDEAAERDERVLITDVVLCEVEWVLESAYAVTRERILVAIQALAADERFQLEDAARVDRALRSYQRSSADLSDLLLGLRGRELGATSTYTFDRVLRGIDGFTVLQ